LKATISTIGKVTDCLKQCLEWSDLQLFRNIIEILATKGCMADRESLAESVGTIGFLKLFIIIM